MTAAAPADAPARRSELRSVAMPSEHGGWGLTAEPALAGLIVAPSRAGACIALAALVAFVARTPLKVVAVDRRRHRTLPRTRLAARVAALEVTALIVLVVVAVQSAESPFWIVAALAAPLIALEAWFEVRSRGRRLVPELAGSIAVAGVSAMIVLAGGQPLRLALAMWLVLAARCVTSIPWVRAQVARLHRDPTAAASPTFDLASAALGVLAIAIDRRLLLGAGAAAMVIAVQHLWGRRPPPRPAVIGIRQMLLGVGVAIAAALG